VDEELVDLRFFGVDGSVNADVDVDADVARLTKMMDENLTMMMAMIIAEVEVVRSNQTM
jgi:hypothetical protein